MECHGTAPGMGRAGLSCSQCRQGGCLQFYTRTFLLLLFSCPKHKLSQMWEWPVREQHQLCQSSSLSLCGFHTFCFFYLAPPEALHQFFGWCFRALVLQTRRTRGISCSRLQTWEHTSHTHFEWSFTNPPAFFPVLCCCFSSPLMQHFYKFSAGSLLVFIFVVFTELSCREVLEHYLIMLWTSSQKPV